MCSPRLVLMASRLQRMMWSGSTNVLGWSRSVSFETGMTVALEIRGRRKKITSKSSQKFPMEPRVIVEPGSGKHCVHTPFPKDPKIWLKTKKEGLRVGAVVAPAEHFGHLISADHKILNEESESRNTIIDMLLWYKKWQRSGLQS